MRKLWYLVWIVICFGGSAVPIEAKYITGFMAGCLAMAALRMILVM